MIMSCIIPVKDPNDPMLKDLIASIRAQDFDQSEIEILVETEGDSEQAKAAGIRRATGEICVMLCADNYLWTNWTFKQVYELFEKHPNATGLYSQHYNAHIDGDNSLNRYFALIGANDPIAYYLGKADRLPHFERYENVDYCIMDMMWPLPSLGDNGFFYRTSHIKQADLDHYYPMDCAVDLAEKGMRQYIRLCYDYVQHRTTDGNLLTFLTKRYRYARDLYCDRSDRRWRMVDTKEDRWRLFIFGASTITVLPAIWISIAGYIKVRDFAWFWHWPVCFGFLITYGLLACRNLLKYQSLFQRPAQTVSSAV